jgi:magnesium transporter
MEEIKIKENIRWIKLLNPTEEEVRKLGEELKLHPIICESLMKRSDRSKVEIHKHCLFLIYHLPVYDPAEQVSRRAEMDIVALKDTLITTIYEPLEPLDQFGQDLNDRLKGKISDTAEMLYYLLQEMNEFSMRQLRHVEKKLNHVGEQLFNEADRDLLKEISYIKRDLLAFSIIAVPQHGTLSSLLESCEAFWGEDSKVYFSRLLGDFLKVQHLLDNLKSTIESYSTTVSQLFQLDTAVIMKRFSVLALLTFPLMLYSTIALQPTVEKTFIRTPQDFWMVFGIIFLVIIAFAFALRKKGWF